MKKIRKIAGKWQIIMPVIFVFIFVSCYNDDGQIVKKEYSGEEIFRGVFFLQGNVARDLESLRPNVSQMEIAEKSNPDTRSFYENFVNEIIYQINSLDPSYFDNFKNQIQSENYYAIELALANGSKMIKAAGLKSETLSGVFRLMTEIQNKKVDFESEDIKHLDFENAEDAEKLKLILKKDYAIDLDDEQYNVACIPVAAVCVVYAVAAVVSIGAVAYTAVAAVQGVVWLAYYASVEAWGTTTFENNIASSDALVKEIAIVF